MVLDTVITIVNYNRHMFIVQATALFVGLVRLVAATKILRLKTIQSYRLQGLYSQHFIYFVTYEWAQ
jgi:hypothetical protein